MGVLEWLNETFREMGEFQREQRGLAILQDPSSFKSTGDFYKDIEILEGYRISCGDARKIAEKFEKERAAVRRAEIWRTYDDFHARCSELLRKYGNGLGCDELQRKYGGGSGWYSYVTEGASSAKTKVQRQTTTVNGSNGKGCNMAIRKPTAPADKSAAMAEMLALDGHEAKYRNGKLVEGTVCGIKGNDVCVDIGYRSVGVINLGEFAGGVEGKTPSVKVGDRVTVMIVQLEDEWTGMVKLSKKRADDRLRWEKILKHYEEGRNVTGTVKSVVRGGLIVQVDGVEAFLPNSLVEMSPVSHLEFYLGQKLDLKVSKLDNERRRLVVSRRELLKRKQSEKGSRFCIDLQIPSDKTVYIDGSNLALWFKELKSKALVLLMAALETAHLKGYIVFDRTIRYRLQEAGDDLGLAFLDYLEREHSDCMKIVPADSQSDDYILMLADNRGCHIISNDQFKQYRDRYKWLMNRTENGRRVHKIEVVDGELMLPTVGISVRVDERIGLGL